MAYVAGFTTKSNIAKATTLVFAAADFPPHAIDEYLVIGITSEAEAVTTHTATAGWTQIGTTVGSGTTAVGLYSSMWYKKCASAAETCTITLSVTNASHGHAFLIREADLTTFVDVSNGVYTAVRVQTFNSQSITTTQPDTLLLFYNGIDSITTTPTQSHSRPGPCHFLESSDNGGANVTAGTKVMAGASCGWYFQRTAGATPTPSWNISGTTVTGEARTTFVVAIRNDVGGSIPAYVDDYLPIGYSISDLNWWVSATIRNNNSFKATPLSIATVNTHLGAKTTTWDAAAQVVDVHLNPYSAAVSSTPATSLTNLCGYELGFPTTALDMSAGWFVGTLMESGPKLANFNEGSIANGGTFLLVADAANNYKTFQVMAKDNVVNCEGRAVFSVQINQTQTQSGQSTVAPTITAINKMMMLNIGHTATLAQYNADFMMINKLVVAGGSALSPVDTEGVFNVGHAFRVKIVQKLGSYEIMPLVPIQIGGGDAVNFQINAGALQFPRIYDRLKKEINYHGATNAIGISYAGKLGDVIKHTNSVVTSPSPYYFEINTAATNQCSWDFTGLAVVNANVTLRNVTTFSSMAFSACPSISAGGCTLSGCTIADVPTTNDSFII